MSTPIVRYRKRPVEVDTIQWTGHNEAELVDFTGGGFRLVDPAESGFAPDITGKVYDELHDTWVGMKTGQHVVKGVRGEHYPIAEDVLAETYELADSAKVDAHRSKVLAAAAIDLLCERPKYANRAIFCDGITHAADRLTEWAKAGEKASAPAPAATPDFFQPGHTYTRGQHGDTIRFLVEHVSTSPDGSYRVAHGWRTRSWEPGWEPSDSDDLTGWTDTEAGGQ